MGIAYIKRLSRSTMNDLPEDSQLEEKAAWGNLRIKL
jgi:hypothetical protein